MEFAPSALGLASQFISEPRGFRHPLRAKETQVVCSDVRLCGLSGDSGRRAVAGAFLAINVRMN